MRNRVQSRYSACFKQRVISELESGRFASAEAARVHYGIGGSSTIDKWLRRYGRNHLRAKVVIVQVPDEIDQLKALRQQVAELERSQWLSPEELRALTLARFRSTSRIRFRMSGLSSTNSTFIACHSSGSTWTRCR